MSDQESQAPSPVTRRLASLCKEYTKTLGSMRHRASELAQAWTDGSNKASLTDLDDQLIRIEFDALQRRCLSLSPALHELAGAMSQQIEHSALTFPEKLELKVRLKEFEVGIFDTQSLINQLHQLIHTSKRSRKS